MDSAHDVEFIIETQIAVLFVDLFNSGFENNSKWSKFPLNYNSNPATTNENKSPANPFLYHCGI